MFIDNLLLSGSNLLPALPLSDAGIGGNMALRGIIPAANFSFKGYASAIRVSFGGNSSNPGTISLVYVGHAAAAPNFDGGQVQIKFGGSASVNLSAGGLAISDITPFSFNPTKDLIVSLGFTTYYAKFSTQSGITDYYKIDGSAEAPNTTVSGYTIDTTGAAVFNAIEVFR